MPLLDASLGMDARRREAKKTWQAVRLRALSPSQTLEMGFSLSNFGAELAKAAEDARR